MDLAELRINQTAVTQNSKCQSCVHYNGNAAAKGGACEVGQMPQVCGSGGDRKYGFAPLDELGPDEIDDLATPCIGGGQGAMNEYGQIENQIVMKRVCLGDEDLNIAQRIHGQLITMQKSNSDWTRSQGHVNVASLAESGTMRFKAESAPMYFVAKSLRDLHFAPRKQRKYDLEAVMDFLLEKGMAVTDADYDAAGIKKSILPTHSHIVTGPQAPHGRGFSNVKQARAAVDRMDKTYGASAHTYKPNPQHVPAAPNVTPIAKAGGRPFNLQKAEGERGGKIIGHTKSGKPIYEGGHGLWQGHAASIDHSGKADKHGHHRLNSNGASADAYHASAKAHGVKAHYEDFSQKATHPKHWKADDHEKAAEAHEEAAIRARHAASFSPASDAPDGRHAYYTKDHFEREAGGHDMRATEHHLKAQIAEHYHGGNMSAAHDKAKELNALPHGNVLSRQRTLAHVQKKTHKNPHIESVARDADIDGLHDKAAAIRRQRKDPLAKAEGEGSHGGHVIGHTKSGKPVYGPHKTHHGVAGRGASEMNRLLAAQHVGAQHSDHSFTKQDHKDASELHAAESKKAGMQEYGKRYSHEAISGEHGNMSRGQKLYEGQYSKARAEHDVKFSGWERPWTSETKKSIPNVTRIA